LKHTSQNKDQINPKMKLFFVVQKFHQLSKAESPGVFFVVVLHQQQRFNNDNHPPPTTIITLPSSVG